MQICINWKSNGFVWKLWRRFFQTASAVFNLFIRTNPFVAEFPDFEIIFLEPFFEDVDCSVTGFFTFNRSTSTEDLSIHSTLTEKNTSSGDEHSMFYRAFKGQKIYFSNSLNSWSMMKTTAFYRTSQHTDIISFFDCKEIEIETLEELHDLYYQNIIYYDSSFLDNYFSICDFHIRNDNIYSDLCLLTHFQKFYDIISDNPDITHYMNVDIELVFHKMIEMLSDQKDNLLDLLSHSIEFSSVTKGKSGPKSSKKKSIQVLINDKIAKESNLLSKQRNKKINQTKDKEEETYDVFSQQVSNCLDTLLNISREFVNFLEQKNDEHSIEAIHRLSSILSPYQSSIKNFEAIDKEDVYKVNGHSLIMKTTQFSSFSIPIHTVNDSKSINEKIENIEYEIHE